MAVICFKGSESENPRKRKREPKNAKKEIKSRLEVKSCDMLQGKRKREPKNAKEEIKSRLEGLPIRNMLWLVPSWCINCS